MRINYLVATVITLSALTSVDAKADNTVSVLQFGTANVSSTTQIGPVNNTATTLQFGATNQATSVQLGSLSSVNSATIGQGGTTPTASISASTAARRLNDVNSDMSSPLDSIPTRPLR